MPKHNWTKFIKRIPIKASAAKIYDAWTTPAGLESWFLRKAEFTNANHIQRPPNSHIQKGDTYEWMWYGHPDSGVERRKVLEANGLDFLQFTFSGECTVSVAIKHEQGETIVELSQENIPMDENPATNLFVGCGEGWTFYLTNLKSILEGGIDLRNKNLKIQNVLNA